MKKLIVTINDQEIPIVISPEGVPIFEGIDTPSEIRRLDDSTYFVVRNGRSHRINIAQSENGFTVVAGGMHYDVLVESEREILKKKYSTQSGARKHRAEIHSPMPALVSRVHVAVGDQVEAGQGLLVLEAMKMENEIKAPQPGIVKEVHVAAGTTVEKGALLLLLDKT